MMNAKTICIYVYMWQEGIAIQWQHLFIGSWCERIHKHLHFHCSCSLYLFSLFSLQNVNYETAALRSPACQSLCTKKCQLNLLNNLILLQSQRLIPFLTFFTSVCHVFTLPRLDKHMVWDWVIPDSVTFLRDYCKTHARFNTVLYWSIRPLQTLSTYRCHLSSVTHQLKRLYKHQCLQVCTF